MANTSFENVVNTSSAGPPPSYCGVPDAINTDIVWWIEGVLLSTFGVLGLLGNLITFYVLSKIGGSYNIFNKLLMQLIFGDSISIIFFFVNFALRKGFHVISLADPIYAYMWPKFIYPFMKITCSWIMCCQISIAIER